MNEPVRLKPDTTDEGADRRATASVGRSARLELTFASRHGRTVLTRAYAEPPFRVGRLLTAGSRAHLIVVCCGPGILGGDRFDQRVTLESGARVTMVSQAALKVHPAPDRVAAVVNQEYHVADGAELDCFWDPLIPFADSRLHQRIDLRVAAGGRLFWSDGLMAGRAAHAESWRFTELRHQLAVAISDERQYLERYCLAPGARNPRRDWVAGPAPYSGTTVVYGDEVSAARADRVQEALDRLARVRGGVDCVTGTLAIGRVLAEHGPSFVAARTVFRELFNQPTLRR